MQWSTFSPETQKALLTYLSALANEGIERIHVSSIIPSAKDIKTRVGVENFDQFITFSVNLPANVEYDRTSGWFTLIPMAEVKSAPILTADDIAKLVPGTVIQFAENVGKKGIPLPNSEWSPPYKITDSGFGNSRDGARYAVFYTERNIIPTVVCEDEGFVRIVEASV